MFDQGNGPPLVVVQGLHGRWEWTKPALRELSKRCRTIGYSLCGDFGSAGKIDPQLGMDNYVRQLEDVLDRARLRRAALCGISFGGFVALRYAARRPERVSALVLVSTPGPGWEPTAQQVRWLSRPWLSAPAFVVGAPFRMWPEMTAALPRVTARVAFMARHAVRGILAPPIPSLIAQRIADARAANFESDYARITAPTLVVTGENGLDRVVPAEITRRYASRIRGATHVVLDRTGHIGVLTQPERFARVVGEFVRAHSH